MPRTSIKKSIYQPSSVTDAYANGRFPRRDSFGESHGPAVGSLVEGMPAGTEIDEKRLIEDMIQRRPGAKLTSKRKETDHVEILSESMTERQQESPSCCLLEMLTLAQRIMVSFQTTPGQDMQIMLPS